MAYLIIIFGQKSTFLSQVPNLWGGSTSLGRCPFVPNKSVFFWRHPNYFWRKAARVNYLLKVSAPSIVSTCNRILDGYTHVGGVNTWHLTEILHHNAKHNLQFRPSVQEIIAHLKTAIQIIKINIGMGYTSCIF